MPRPARRRTTFLAILLGLALSMQILPAQAFESAHPSESPHAIITTNAAAPLGWKDSGLQSLRLAVMAPDIEETKIKADAGKVHIIDASDDYEPSHHCDRLPNTSHAEAFASTAAYTRLQRDTALHMMHAGHPERALTALGRALHALQDCHSHSDVTEFAQAEQEAFQRALLDEPTTVQGLRITGFQPGAPEPEMPPEDDYPHGLYAKDGANATTDAQARLPDGRTKFEAAMDLATATSALLLQDFLSQLNETQKERLFTLEPVEQAQKSVIPSPGIAAAIVASLIVLRRRLP